MASESAYFILFLSGLYFCLLVICTGFYRDADVLQHTRTAHHNHY
jgi:hypothetical protein